MREIALKLPGQTEVQQGFPYLKSELSNATLGELISQFAVVAFYIVGFLSFIWFAWGVFEYIFAGGGKEGLGRARKRMTWAIVGLVFFVLSFALSQYAETIFENKTTTIREVKEPPPVVFSPNPNVTPPKK